MVSVREAKPQDLKRKTPLEWLDTQLTEKPEDTGLWYAKGALLAKMGEHEKAVEAFDKVTWLDADHIKAWDAKGKALLRLGSYLEAVDCFERLCVLAPRDEAVWYYKGEALLKLGRYKEAVKCYDKAIELNPGFTDAWYGKGNALKEVGKEVRPAKQEEEKKEEGKPLSVDFEARLAKFEEALRCFSQVIQIDPTFIEAVGEQGATLCEMGRYEEGLSLMDKAIQASPKRLQFLMNKAEVLKKMGKKKEAKDTLVDLAERPFSSGEDWDPDSWYSKAHASLELERWDDAIKYSDELLKVSPSDPRAWNAKGDALAKLGNYTEAMKCYENAVKAKPHFEHAWRGLGNVQRAMGQHDNALKSYDRAIQTNPLFVEAWHDKGTLLYVLQRFTEAWTCFLEVLKIDPEHLGAKRRKEELQAILGGKRAPRFSATPYLMATPAVQAQPPRLREEREIASQPPAAQERGEGVEDMLLRAEKLLSEGKHQESLEIYEKILQIDQGEFRAWEGKSNALAKLARFSESAECYEKAIGLRPRDERAWYNRARTLRQAGRHEEALMSYEMAIKLNGVFLEAIKEMRELADEIREKKMKEMPSRGQTREKHLEVDIGPQKALLEVEIAPPAPEEVVSTAEARSTETAKPPPEADIAQKPEGLTLHERARIRTYVDGFDEALNGGVPCGYITLLSGPPGSMKSTLGFWILYNNALREGKKGLYITLEQTTASLLAQMTSLGLNLKAVEGKVEILDVGMFQKRYEAKESSKDWLEFLQRNIESARKDGVELLVIDSLEALQALANLDNPRHDVFRLFEALRNMDITAFAITERKEVTLFGRPVEPKRTEDFLADGILRLALYQMNDTEFQRRIRCVKMRGVKHSTSYHALMFSEGKFKTFKAISGV